MKDASKIPVRLLATIPRGEVDLSEKRRATSLPAGPRDFGAKRKKGAVRPLYSLEP